jgi:hypothetical protein
MSLESPAVRMGDGALFEREQRRNALFCSRFFAFAAVIGGAVSACVSSEGAADSSVAVGFEQAQYQVGIGQAFSVNVALPPLPNGLFSYGIRLNLPVGKVVAGASDAAVVPFPINFNGTAGPGVFRQVTADFIGVKGTVSFDAALEPYRGALLTTFNLKNQAGVGETYTLTLGLFRTLGPTETLFVDGLGVNLDPLITFGSVSVTVVPEPSVAFLLSLPFAWKLASRLMEKGSRA